MNRQSRVVRARVVICVLTSLTLIGCGKSSSSNQTQTQSTSNPVPVLGSVSPTTAAAGSSEVKITASGANFISSSTINWNGTPLTTTYLNSEAVSAEVSATDLQAGGTATITVTNPSPGGGVSGKMSFTVTNPAPILTSINPTSATAGGSGITITATGTHFTPSSAVTWSGTVIPTTYVNSTTLTAQVSAADLENGGTLSVAVVNPSPGGGTSGGVTFSISDPAPILSSINPATAPAGGSAITLTATGSNFVSSSTINWNGTALTTSYSNSTTLTAQVSAADLATAGSATVTVTNPSPGGGTSSEVTFDITASGITVVNLLANDLAWDTVNQVIYLSLPSTDGSNGNSVQILNPTTAALGAAASAGSEPYLLSVSENSKYLYVSQNGASTVQVMTLPDLGSDLTIQLGSDPVDGPFYAMDLQAAPNSDDTVALVRGTPGYSPEEEGGVIIYDSGTARANVICGWIESGCPNPHAYLMDSIQWNSDGTEMFASNYEGSSFDFYTVEVSSSGFGTVADYPGVASANGLGFFYHIHYDAPTGYVYDDDGAVINPSNGTSVGTFAASGLMVPDGTLGAAFFIGQTTQQLGTSDYTLESFNISTFDPISTLAVDNLVGTPTSLIRWGTNGLAFTTYDASTSPATGAVYIVSSSFVSGAARPTALTLENVHRTWKPRNVLSDLQSTRKAER